MSPLSTTSEIKMIRNTEIEIHGSQVQVAYKVDDGEITGLRLKFGEKYGTVDAFALTYVDSVREALEDHHANLLVEDNINV